MPVTPFPRPKSFVAAERRGAPADAPVVVSLDADLPEQGFRLSTSPEGVSVVHRDAAGLRYALQTLDQLKAGADFGDVAYTVEDAPDFAVRGFMLDISRDRVPTRRTLARWVELLSLARINQFELYTEHTFAFSGHQQVWQDASPMTPEDVHWLDARCAAAGIALVPNQNTLGHMERWLAHEPYAGRAENPDGFEFGGRHRAPSTVEPTAENARFVLDLLDDVVPHFRTRRLNVGADEPFELGTGKTKARAEAEGIGSVYFEYVTQLLQPWVDRGYNVEFWADVFGDHPALMDRVPAGAVPVVWQYDSPSLTAAVIDGAGGEELAAWKASGIDVEGLRNGFRDRAKLLLEGGVPFWVAPGTSSWNSVLGRLDNAVENMVDAATVGIENGATGYLNTAWGDNGMWEPPSVAFGPALFGGAVSWNLEANRDIDLAAVLDEHVLHDPTGTTGSVLDRTGRICAQLGVATLNASPLYRALFNGGDLPAGTTPSDEALTAAAQVLAQCREELRTADPASADGDVVVRELTQAIRLSELAVQLLLARSAGGGTVPAADARRLLLDLERLLLEQRACWSLRSRPGGLDDSIGHFDTLRHALTSAATR